LGMYLPVGTDPTARFMIKSMFTPTPVISSQECSSPWSLPGAPSLHPTGFCSPAYGDN
jgi:hypothetical protein